MNKDRKKKKVLSLILAAVMLLQPQLLAYALEEPAAMFSDGELSDGTDSLPDIDGGMGQDVLPMPTETPEEGVTPMPTETPEEGVTPMPTETPGEPEEGVTPMPTETPGESEEGVTPTPTETPAPTETPQISVPSDGSLAGLTMWFVDVKWEEGEIGEIQAVFDGGTMEPVEIFMISQGEGRYTVSIPDGDYSTVAFRMLSEEWITIAGPWNYYGDETTGENTVKFAPETMDTFYYNKADSTGGWGEQKIPEPVYPSDGSLAGETLKFVNLYWETEDLGNVEAVFDGGCQDACVQTMSRGDRGVYETVIPSGDYSGISFRMEGSDSLFEGSTYNIYGNTSDQKRDSVSFIPEQNNTFYYDPGTTPSYWGADPDYETLSPEEPVKIPVESQASAVNALVDEIEERTERAVSKAPETVEAVPEPGNPTQGQMVYFIDMYGVEKAAEGVPVPPTQPGDPYREIERVHIAFLKENHNSPPNLSEGVGTDGEVYTMYEKREGIYTAPFPKNVSAYSEIAFQTVDAGGTNVVDLERHYNFRNQPGNSGEISGYFNYTSGKVDAFFLNRSQNESHWGAHPSVADASLDTRVLYIDVSERTGNNIYADVDNLWIKWHNMPAGTEEQILGGKYDTEKGYKAVNVINENVRYFQFPYNSNATENTVLTITFSLAGDTTDETEYTFRMMYVGRGGRNCLLLDNIWEFNGQMFGKFEAAPPTGGRRTIFFDNLDTGFTQIQVRTKDPADSKWGSWQDFTKVPNNSSVYKEGLYQAEIDDNKMVQFKGTKSDKKTYYSNSETVSKEFQYPCYYAFITGPADNSAPNKDVDNPGITGYWRSVYSVDTAGDKSINIPSGTFKKEENVYYARTNFYDYYSDWEMSGRFIKDWNAGESEYTAQAQTFNAAAEKYYQEATEYWTEEQKNNFKALYLTGNVGDNYKNPYEKNEKYWKGDGDWNRWTGKGEGPKLEMIDRYLADGTVCTPDGILLPFFNEDFLRGNNKLGTAVGNVYKNVLFPFAKDADKNSRTYGYWTFDSSRDQDAMRLSYDLDVGYFLHRTGAPIAFNENMNAFFPFNDPSDFNNAGHVEPEKSKVNELFGTRFQIDFKLTENAEIYNESKNKWEEIKFEFQGDDDTWIFVDGILALDLGGIHDAVRGEINFKDGTYTIWKAIKNGSGYNGPGTVYQEGKLDENLINRLKDRNSQHTLTIFYMERGLYESNLKVSFNFPKQNTFSVEKEVDVESTRTAGEADIFSGLLENMGAFAFELKNLVTSGEALPVEQSAGYIKPGESRPVYNASTDADFSFTEGAGTATKSGEKYSITQNGNISGAVPDEKALLKVQPKNNMDVSEMQYLRMGMKNTGANDASASNLYLSFVDGNGRRVGGYVGAMGYDGENNSFVSGEDTVIRVDFRQMTGDSGFSWNNVSYMLIGVRKLHEAANASYDVSSIAFMGKTSENPTQGFAVENRRISDYGSYNTGMLTPVDKAWYTKKTRTGSSYNAGVSRATDNGEFSLADNQVAVFTDKFRTGSYLSLTEKNVDPRVFDTTWSVKEYGEEIPGNYLLSTRDDMVSVINPIDMLVGKGYPLSNFKGTQSGSSTTVYDGRQEVVSPSWGNTAFQHPDLKTTLVYRGYRDPDSSLNEPTEIKVEVKNTLKRGSLTITKKLAESMMEDNGKFRPADYTFDIYYTDIAGMGLEFQLMPDEKNQRYIKQTVTVHVDESGVGRKVVHNIPSGTSYWIVERPSNGATLVNIETGQGSDHENVKIYGIKGEGENQDYSNAYAGGTAYTGNQEFIFTNENKPFYMDIAKIWKDGLTDTEREEKFGITEVHIQLQRRIIHEGMGAEDGWETVTKDFFDNTFTENEKDYVKLNKENGWKTTSKVTLPVFDETAKQAYEYRIQEIGSDGNLNYYQVTYEEEENLEAAPGTPEKEYKHITYKAVNSSAGLQIKKEWDDRDDIAGIRPDKIRVKLMVSDNWTAENPESALWSCYKGIGQADHVCSDSCYEELTRNQAWEKVITGLPVKNQEGKLYYYRIAEEEMLYSYGDKSEWVKAENDPYSYQGEYGSPRLPDAGNTPVLLVKNKIPLGNITISKKSEETKEDLKGAEFKLERLIEEEGVEDFRLKPDERFAPRTGITTETGMIYFENLPYGKYRITETKAPDGYVLLKNPVYVTLNDEAFAQQAKEHKNDPTYDAAKKTITITIFNSKFLHLPESGGKGTFMFTMAGAFLLGAALLLYIRKRKLQ